MIIVVTNQGVPAIEKRSTRSFLSCMVPQFAALYVAQCKRTVRLLIPQIPQELHTRLNNHTTTTTLTLHPPSITPPLSLHIPPSPSFAFLRTVGNKLAIHSFLFFLQKKVKGPIEGGRGGEELTAWFISSCTDSLPLRISSRTSSDNLNSMICLRDG